MPKKKKKIFVLDTSVILYDHSCVLNFEENDVVIPISVIEELDNFKKGNDMLNFSAREFSRYLDKLSKKGTLHEWVPIKSKNSGQLCIEMIEQSQPDATEVFNSNKADHRILNVAIKYQAEHPKQQVVLVTKDINLRIKAKALSVQAEDYETGKVKDVENLQKGKTLIEGLETETIDKLYKEERIGVREAKIQKAPVGHKYYILRNSTSSALAWYNPEAKQMERVEKRAIHGITPRNAEQVFAVHALMNPQVRLVTIQGVAGTGKTLLALAAALEQRQEYQQIYLARPIVPLSNKDIGFLPGDVNSKISPYMEPLYDNLKFIRNQFSETSKEYKRIGHMQEQEKLLITPLAYIRGRSLSNIYFIVDEAQNLTPHEVKTIITRAGDGTKIIFTGDVFQIDTPYLDSQSNGLSYLIDRLEGQPLCAHINLEKGERSELANLANELL